MAISKIDSARPSTQDLQNDQPQTTQQAQKLELFQKEVLEKSPVVKITFDNCCSLSYRIMHATRVAFDHLSRSTHRLQSKNKG